MGGGHTWRVNRATPAFVERDPEWSGEPRTNRTSRRGGGPATPPGGRLRRPVFPLGDASSAPRLRAPGSRGWEPVRCADRAARASSALCELMYLCYRPERCIPPLWLLLERVVFRLKRKKKRCPPDQNIHNFHVVQFENLNPFPPFLLIHESSLC